MHELSIAMNLIEVACEEAERRDVRIVALHVTIGPLSGVVRDALISAFEIACESSPLGDIRFEIVETQVTMQCSVCEAETLVVSLQELRCRQCGEPARQITGGRELELTALEIEA
ncbi:MAG: hydrogenase maturation nickel metallochaperone HypA [Pirellulaceae bacterium]